MTNHCMVNYRASETNRLGFTYIICTVTPKKLFEFETFEPTELQCI